MKRGSRFPNCKYLYSTDHPDTAVVELVSLLGVFSGNAVKAFVVNRNDPNSMADAETGLTLNVMIRDVQNGRSDRAKDELNWWCGTRGIGWGGRPDPDDPYEPMDHNY